MDPTVVFKLYLQASTAGPSSNNLFAKCQCSQARAQGSGGSWVGTSLPQLSPKHLRNLWESLGSMEHGLRTTALKCARGSRGMKTKDRDVGSDRYFKVGSGRHASRWLRCPPGPGTGRAERPGDSVAVRDRDGGVSLISPPLRLGASLHISGMWMQPPQSSVAKQRFLF